MLRKRNERGARSTSSEIDRKFFSPFVLNCIKNSIDLDEVVEIYSLGIFEYSKTNLEKVVSYFRNSKYSIALSVGMLPFGFEDYDIEIGKIIVILTEQDDYFAILYENDSEEAYNPILNYWEKLNQKIDLKQFPFRSLIYPV